MIREVLRSDIVHKSDIYSLLSQSDNKSSSSVRLFWRPTNKLRKELWDSYEKNNSWKIYGAFVDGVIVGIATLLIEPSLDSMNTGHITNVSVKPHHRGTGIGKDVIKYTVERAKKLGCKEVFVTCSNSNVPFYIKCDFSLHEQCMISKIL
jgi:N-acetylglutamate synthase-like GNAT family acetyltransferase